METYFFSVLLSVFSLFIQLEKGDSSCCPVKHEITEEDLNEVTEVIFLDDQVFWNEDEHMILLKEKEMFQKTYIGYRDYSKSVGPEEFKDIHFILKTLSTKSLTSLLKYKSDLKQAGDRVDHLHPLQFLLCMFKDEELKVYIHNLKKRGGWVWGEFYKGIKGSLQEEYDIGNLTDEMIVDFTEKVKIDLNLILDDIKDNSWENFIKTLIVNIPRDGDSGRYDQ